MCLMLKANLTRRDFHVRTCRGADEAFAALRADDFDVVLSDINMPGENGIDLCARIVADRPDVPVIVITAFGSLDTAIAAIRAGAYDFLPKPFEIDALMVALNRAVQHRALRAEVKRLRREVDAARRFDDLVGDSPAMRRVYDMIERVKDSSASVLVTGESGSGKELVARALHRRSARGDGPFVAVNCAAVPETLLESELFGHARGAFTDAKTARAGLFVKANGGTLFLDEIGELPIGLQPKLLRALQERRVRPVGADADVPFDARIVTATNRDLEAAVEERRFREDLYYRVNVISLALPPLRARGNDVLLLAQSFLDRFASLAGKRITGLSAPAAARLLAYAWPGNVRELQNCMERAVALAEYSEITIEDLPERMREARSSQVVVVSDDPAEFQTMEEVERRYVLRVLEAAGGNKSVAARILGFDRTTLYRKLERFGVGGERGDPPSAPPQK
ncbi:MAG: sigma-54-dependent Fis family transcriptional regulator [Deltaproteobacteria bacterium]|nr:sigma-54-dependent Fis family transcriptional regulator [Deltaproteobacteria bacterium]